MTTLLIYSMDGKFATVTFLASCQYMGLWGYLHVLWPTEGLIYAHPKVRITSRTDGTTNEPTTLLNVHSD
jgi:hypothetical protein